MSLCGRHKNLLTIYWDYNATIPDMVCVACSDIPLQLEQCDFIAFYGSTNLSKLPVNPAYS